MSDVEPFWSEVRPTRPRPRWSSIGQVLAIVAATLSGYTGLIGLLACGFAGSIPGLIASAVWLLAAALFSALAIWLGRIANRRS